MSPLAVVTVDKWIDRGCVGRATEGTLARSEANHCRAGAAVPKEGVMDSASLHLITHEPGIFSATGGDDGR
jgi:hypothetical protein